MRSDYGKLLRKEFDKSFTAAFPQFARSARVEIPQGCRLYEWRASSGLTAFILLNVFQQSEYFTLDLGWTTSGLFPFSRAMPLPERDGCYRLRISELWKGRRDCVWKVTAQKTIQEATLDELGQFDFDFTSPPPPITNADREVLRSAVADGIAKIKEYAIPYLEKMAKEVSKDN